MTAKDKYFVNITKKKMQIYLILNYNATNISLNANDVIIYQFKAKEIPINKTISIMPGK